MEKTLEDNILKQRTERIFFLWISVSSVIILIVLALLLRIQSLRNRQRKIIAGNRQEIMKLELEKEKYKQTLLEQQLKEQEAIALLEQQRLTNEINEKKRQLAAKVLFQTNRDKLFTEINAILSEISQQSEKSSLKSIAQKLNKLQQESVENSFFTYFDQINPMLLSALQKHHPELTAGDIRLLSYIYLNLSVKEIATLLNVLPDSLKKKKRRIADKMNINTTQLHSYLNNLIKQEGN
jgi:DNA-binding CsgD family transcriptional regulator